jgi:basic membrane protein A
MRATQVSRRMLLKTAAFGAAGATLGLGAARRASAAQDLTVGVVYVGARDDFGWNQAHAVAIKALKEVPGVKVVEEENVPETDAVSKSMESMINLDGAGLILATSFGYYKPFVVDLAKK